MTKKLDKRINKAIADQTAPKDYIVEGKPDLSLLPLDILEGYATALEYGCKKYARNSWRKGFQSSVVVAACLRHISCWNDQGLDFDREAKEREGMNVHHIDMAIFNLVALKNTILNHPNLIDRYTEEEK